MSTTQTQMSGSSHRSGYNGYGSSESEQSKSPSWGFGRIWNKPTETKGSDNDGRPPPQPKKRGPKPDSKPAKDRRAELNRVAQRTHRERKENYLKEVEAGKRALQELHEQTVKERNLAQEENHRLKEENHRLRELLHARGIRYPTDTAMFRHETSSSDSFSGSYRTPSSTSGTHSPPPLRDEVRYQPLRLPATGIDYESVGLKFISEIEKPCMHHVRTLWLASQLSRFWDTSRNTEDDVVSDPESPLAEFGHANMLTCPSSHYLMADTDEPFSFNLENFPEVDLWTLLSRCHALPLTTTEFTPAMAWFALMGDERFPLLSEDDLEEIKRDLLLKQQCYGFGAVVQDFELADAIENVLAQRMDCMKL